MKTHHGSAIVLCVLLFAIGDANLHSTFMQQEPSQDQPSVSTSQGSGSDQGSVSTSQGSGSDQGSVSTSQGSGSDRGSASNISVSTSNQRVGGRARLTGR